MKWLKLDCDFSEDPKIQCLCREWGSAEAISFWALLLSFVGRYGGKECRVKLDPIGQYTETFAAQKMMTKPLVLDRRLSRVALLSLICPSSWEQKREIFIPNMLKRVDEYTRKLRTLSVQTPKPSIKEEKKESTKERKEENRETDIETLPRVDVFENLWNRYPVKDGRKEAERHFSASVKTEQDLTDIDIALEHYLEHVAHNPWKRIKNGKTWFHNWRDWISWIEPTNVNGNPPKQAVPPLATSDLAMQQFYEQEALEKQWAEERKQKGAHHGKHR
jgi:hypothetical protein